VENCRKALREQRNVSDAQLTPAAFCGMGYQRKKLVLGSIKKVEQRNALSPSIIGWDCFWRSTASRALLTACSARFGDFWFIKLCQTAHVQRLLHVAQPLTECRWYVSLNGPRQTKPAQPVDNEKCRRPRIACSTTLRQRRVGERSRRR
jgi:hypothetical protein